MVPSKREGTSAYSVGKKTGRRGAGRRVGESRPCTFSSTRGGQEGWSCAGAGGQRNGHGMKKRKKSRRGTKALRVGGHGAERWNAFEGFWVCQMLKLREGSQMALQSRGGEHESVSTVPRENLPSEKGIKNQSGRKSTEEG